VRSRQRDRHPERAGKAAARLLLLGIWLGGIAAFWGWDGGVSAQQPPTEAAITVEIEQSVNPAQIVVRGTGSPDRATVTLALVGPAVDGEPIDLMLVLDRSSSVDFERVREIARTFILHLSKDDRVGIVSFAEAARVELSLTDDKAQALEVLEGLEPGVQTALGDGLALGVEELAQGRREGAHVFLIVPTDGVQNVGREPLSVVERAQEAEIPIYPIGLSPAARRQLLSELARRTGGAFFGRFSLDVLENLFRRAEREVAARFILITETLPGGILFEQALENPPSVSRGRELTQLQWNVPLLLEGQRWQAQYEISALEEGTFGLNQWPSVVQYTDPEGRPVTLELPAVAVRVGRGPGGPPGPGEPGEQPEEPEEPEAPQPEPANEPPTAALTFAPEGPVMGEAVRFDASGSQDPDGEIVKYEWDWTNDGTFDYESEGPQARHPYGSPGEYTVRLRVTDDRGATAEAVVTVTVAEGLKAGAAVSTDFAGDPTVPEWMDYYIDDGVVTDEEVRDANARFAADVFIPGTQYRLTSADVQAIIQINALAKIVAAYERPQAAEEAGYVRVGDYIDGVGQHYVKEEFLVGEPSYDRPPVLLYYRDGTGWRLAGVRFISTNSDAVLFQVADWPDHPASAHFEDGTEQAAASAENAPLKNSKGSPLAFWHPTLYGLTVWVGIVNPDGLFAPRHPDL